MKLTALASLAAITLAFSSCAELLDTTGNTTTGKTSNVSRNTTVAPSRTVTVSTVISGRTVNFDAGTRVVFNGGRYKNCTLVGNNTVVEYAGDAVVFENCDFKGTFVNSKLKATNFGCVPDMKSASVKWKFKNKGFWNPETKKYAGAMNINERRGTDNTRALKSMARFMSGSQGVTMNINGAFYSAPDEKGNGITLYVAQARDLEITGGTIIAGIDLVNCCRASLHHINFVGFHETHDFPLSYYKTERFESGPFVNKLRAMGCNVNNTYNYAADGGNTMGLSGKGVGVWKTGSRKIDDHINSKDMRCEDITVSNCYFEMRSNGVYLGQGAVPSFKNLYVHDCKFSHIYWQPIGLHSNNTLVTDCTIDYCGQAVDFSEYSFDCTVERVNATRCNTGPKQEVINESRNTGYNNVLRNCSFEITDVRTCVDDEQYVLRVARGVKGSTFLVEDCNFKVKTRNKTFVGAMLWNHNVVMNRVNFDLDVTTCWNKNLKTREYEYMPDGAIPALFSGYEWTPDTLHLTMNDVTVTLRGDTRITTMFANAATVNATRFKVVQAEQSKQTLRIDNCIENVVDSKFENSTFDVPFNCFAHTKNRIVKVNNSSILQGRGIVFDGEGDYNAKRFAQGTQFVVTNSRIETSSAFTYVSPSVGNYSMKATGNTIKAKTLLDGEQKTGGYQLKKFDVELKNNRLPADAQKLINTKKLTDSKLVNKSTLRVTGNTISTK